MDTNDRKFPEQEAPGKNTDQAFVQVGDDGNPVVPQTADDEEELNDEQAATEKEVD